MIMGTLSIKDCLWTKMRLGFNSWQLRCNFA